MSTTARLDAFTDAAFAFAVTLLLVFTVLVYVHPLRAMAASFAAFLGGEIDRFDGYLGAMFRLYGIGFMLMCVIMVALFADVMRHHGRGEQSWREARGQAIIWSILVATGLVSVELTLFRATVPFAPIVYATLPISIGLFASRYRWAPDE